MHGHSLLHGRSLLRRQIRVVLATIASLSALPPPLRCVMLAEREGLLERKDAWAAAAVRPRAFGVRCSPGLLPAPHCSKPRLR